MAKGCWDTFCPLNLDKKSFLSKLGRPFEAGQALLTLYDVLGLEMRSLKKQQGQEPNTEPGPAHI